MGQASSLSVTQQHVRAGHVTKFVGHVIIASSNYMRFLLVRLLRSALLFVFEFSEIVILRLYCPGQKYEAGSFKIKNVQLLQYS